MDLRLTIVGTLLTGLFVGACRDAPSPPEGDKVELTELRLENQRLRAELATLRASRRDAPPGSAKSTPKELVLPATVTYADGRKVRLTDVYLRYQFGASDEQLEGEKLYTPVRVRSAVLHIGVPSGDVTKAKSIPLENIRRIVVSRAPGVRGNGYDSQSVVMELRSGERIERFVHRYGALTKRRFTFEGNVELAGPTVDGDDFAAAMPPLSKRLFLRRPPPERTIREVVFD